MRVWRASAARLWGCATRSHVPPLARRTFHLHRARNAHHRLDIIAQKHNVASKVFSFLLELLYTLTFVAAAWIVIWICLVPLLFRYILQSVRFFAERCFQSKRTWGFVRLSSMCSSDVHDLYRLCDVWQSVDCCGIECCLCGGRLYGERMLRSSCTTKCQLFVLFRMVKRYSHSFFFSLCFPKLEFCRIGVLSTAVHF